MIGCEPCMHVCSLCVVVTFPAIDSNDECAEEGEVFEYQEEGDQGQANQGKPSTCCISESYYYTMHCFTPAFLLCIVFLYCYYPLDSNSWRLSSTSRLDIIHGDDTPCDLFNTPLIRDLMISIKVFGKLVVEPKTLGLGILSGRISKMFPKTLE
jgi:hypothetical protein